MYAGATIDAHIFKELKIILHCTKLHIMAITLAKALSIQT
jgi:hypothetical protein